MGYGAGPSYSYAYYLIASEYTLTAISRNLLQDKIFTDYTAYSFSSTYTLRPFSSTTPQH